MLFSVASTRKGHNAYKFASLLAKYAGAVGWGPCLQEVGVKTRSRGPIETKTHPSFIMCFGYTNTMRWPDKHTEVPDDFVMGSDVLKELVPVKGGVAWWECNWDGSPSVPHLGATKQKMPNFNMWCRHSFQSCLWLGKSIQSKKAGKC